MGRQIVYYFVLWVANYQMLRSTDLDNLKLHQYNIFIMQLCNDHLKTDPLTQGSQTQIQSRAA